MGRVVESGLIVEGARPSLACDSVLSHAVEGPLPAWGCNILAFPGGHDYIIGLSGGPSALEALGAAAVVALRSGGWRG